MSLVAESTLMFAEAADAGRIMQIQRAANRERIAALVAQLRAEPPRAVLTCARGSSDHAATAAKYLIETRLGLMVASAAPSVSSVYGGNPAFDGMVCLALSQSGSSPDLLATVAAAKAAGATTVALVNTESSPLAALVDRVIPLHAGAEISVAATKSYIATLAAVLDLVATWSDDAQLQQALDASPEMLAAAWQLDWSPMVERLRSARGLFVLGRGPGLGVAQEAALKFKETCGLHAEAFSVAEVRHGPMALIGRDFPVLVFRQSDESYAGTTELIGELVARGGDVLVAGGDPSGGIQLPGIDAHPAIEPMLRIQSFYRAVNALSVDRGFDPDRPPHLAKVTETV
ncbi:SIS domain-containing protein [Glacieibacterium sp.]|uniref:SIS domain-containing protein n=1 Tax=Glacieibacterium sp. TaxID=2860237 RepID=UPI003B00DEC6